MYTMCTSSSKGDCSLSLEVRISGPLVSSMLAAEDWLTSLTFAHENSNKITFKNSFKVTIF